MRGWRDFGVGLAALALGSFAVPGAAPVSTTSASTTPASAAYTRTDKATSAAKADKPAEAGKTASAEQPASAPCAAFPGSRQLPGADGVTPAAWSGGGLVVPACGPVPGEGKSPPVYAFPGALWTAGYQCVEFSERYLYDRYGVTMNVVTNGDKVATNYATNFPGLFMIIKNGTPHRRPADGDVLSLSNAPGFDSASGGHTAVVQSSEVDAAGNGTVTVVEENATASGIAVLTVRSWTVCYPGYRYAEWLTATGQRLDTHRASQNQAV